MATVSPGVPYLKRGSKLARKVAVHTIVSPPGHAEGAPIQDLARSRPSPVVAHTLERLPSIRRGQSLVEFALVLPILMMLVISIGDFARWYSAGITIESAAREAADYGAFSATNWAASNVPGTEAEMRRRACTAASTLSGYRGDPVGTPAMTCTNPSFTYSLQMAPGITDCSVNTNDPPCDLKVTLTYQFNLFTSIPPLPSSFAFTKDSTFAVSPFPAS